MSLFTGWGVIIYVPLLLTNAVAILNEERFLAPIGWSTVQQPVATYDQGGFGDPQGDTIKARLIALISAVRTLLRFPLILANILIIIWELLFG
ncbi:Yos1-like protein [Cantharellus anzutake]|uniref:Yos1-like protein n=1 Tax=Cantharellus anzutake TaxID=1750568 RepID=UPI001907E4BA|nr:Yos1-like protein [Cantharellus anzutake]KAF8341431.1 Yos1-like protein [Cantharellus anzutake]